MATATASIQPKAKKPAKTSTKPEAKQETAKPETAKQEPKAKAKGEGLTKRQFRVLEILAKGDATRKQLAEATEQPKGWSALLGSPTKGKPADGTMQGMGLVTCTKDLPLKYTITAKGKDALATAQPKPR